MSQPIYVRWAVIWGIIIVLNLFFNYSMKLAYNAPEFENFCKEQQIVEKVEDRDACVERGGQWNEEEKIVVQEGETGIVAGHCNLNFVCENNFQEARKIYEKKVFITLVILGSICIVVGIFATTLGVVATALSFGGVLSFIIASIRYWEFASEYLHVFILGIALITLIYIGIKKINKEPNIR